MSAFKNTQKIDTIEFKKNLHCFCPLGQSWCTYQMTCLVFVRDTIPDYMDLEWEFQKMDGMTMTLEDAVDRVFGAIAEQCKPDSIRVSCYCEDAKHFPVTVVKEDFIL